MMFCVCPGSRPCAILDGRLFRSRVVDASHFVVFAARTNVTEAEIDTFIERIARTRIVTPESLARTKSPLTRVGSSFILPWKRQKKSTL